MQPVIFTVRMYALPPGAHFSQWAFPTRRDTGVEVSVEKIAPCVMTGNVSGTEYITAS